MEGKNTEPRLKMRRISIVSTHVQYEILSCFTIAGSNEGLRSAHWGGRVQKEIELSDIPVEYDGQRVVLCFFAVESKADNLFAFLEGDCEVQYICGESGVGC